MAFQADTFQNDLFQIIQGSVKTLIVSSIRVVPRFGLFNVQAVPKLTVSTIKEVPNFVLSGVQ